MEFTYHASIALSIMAFLIYGSSCLLSDGMAAEFERFGLSRFRRLTGGLEVLGAFGLMAGYFLPWLVIVASGGLSLLMILGIITRIRIRDSWTAMLPAFVLLLINLFVLIHAATA
jgi:hypothetical protein